MASTLSDLLGRRKPGRIAIAQNHSDLERIWNVLNLSSDQQKMWNIIADTRFYPIVIELVHAGAVSEHTQLRVKYGPNRNSRGILKKT